MPVQGLGKYHISFDSKLLSHPKFKISEHAGLYMTSTLRVFALSLVGIFLPIYIFNISQASHYQIFHIDPTLNGIIWNLIFYILRSVFTIVAVMLFTHSIFKKWGLGKTIMISLVLLIIEIVFWILAEKHLWLIMVAGVIDGFKVGLYWIPYHIFFAEKLKGESAHFGGSTALRQFLSRFASGIGPILGGVIITFLGFKALFLFSIFVLILCGLPTLYIVSDWKHHDHKPLQIVKKTFKDKKYRYLTLGYLGQGLDASIYDILWPVLMYVILANFEKIGLLSGLTFLLGSLITIAVGKVIDRKGTDLVHGVGTIVNALLYIPRIFLNSALGVYVIDTLDKANAPLFALPSMTIAYEKAIKLGRSDFIVFRELAIHLGIVIGCVLGLVLLLLGVPGRILFIIPFVGSILVYFMDLDGN